MPDINIKSETVEKVVELVSGPLKKLLGPSVEELGLLFSDGLKLRRMKNVATALSKIEKKCAADGISLKPIDLKVVHPFLVNASLEENEELQDVWANLMTNYLDSSKNLTSTVYPSVLAQLSTDDLLLLKEVYDNNQRHDKRISPYTMQTANIQRLGLLHISYIHRVADGMAADVISADVNITDFGIEFVKACRRD